MGNLLLHSVKVGNLKETKHTPNRRTNQNSPRERGAVSQSWRLRVHVTRGELRPASSMAGRWHTKLDKGVKRQACGGSGVQLGPRLVALNSRICHYVKRRFSVISNLQYMHEVLNVDEIKN